MNSISNTFLFSVIIAIYNTAPYLHETIKSLITQSIGFEYIQVILVNDGSTDGSDEICLQYQAAYPKNIRYLKQRNQGASMARNAGLKYVNATYVNFLDSDDMWDSQAFERISEFFTLHPSVELAEGRMKFFGARSDYHNLDFKFNKTKVVNVSTDYYYPHLSASSCFFRFEALSNHLFDPILRHGEDIKFVNSILLSKQLIGHVREAVYYYRKRRDGSSKVQTQFRDKSYYLDSPVALHQYLLDTSQKLYGRKVSFIQYVVMYDLGWRIPSRNFNVLNSSEYKKYCQIVLSILKQIDDNIIYSQTNMRMKTKAYCIREKRSNKTYNLEEALGRNYLHDLPQLISNEQVLTQRHLQVKAGFLIIAFNDWFWENVYNYSCRINSRFFVVPQLFPDRKLDYKLLFGTAYSGRYIEFQIRLKRKTTLEFFLDYNSHRMNISPYYDNTSGNRWEIQDSLTKTHYLICCETNRITVISRDPVARSEKHKLRSVATLFLSCFCHILFRRHRSLRYQSHLFVFPS